jgi:glucose-6-phosphate 1-epimerase
MDSSLDALNEAFGIKGQVCFKAGPGGLVQAVVENEHATATILLMGGHVLTYTPRGQEPVLWVAPHEVFQMGKALHSGVPVCWPWFGSNSEDPQLPLHGLVRTLPWTVQSTRVLEGRAANNLPAADDLPATEVRLAITDTAETRKYWPHAFELEVTVTVGKSLKIEWAARNRGDQPYTYTGALHPYFTVSQAKDVTVTGLDGRDYLDKTENFARHHQQGPVHFTGWTDRVYLDTTADLVIGDPGYRRDIHVRKLGSRTTVVWNAYDHDVDIPAIGAGGHETYVCVEAANAFDDAVNVPPGGEGRLGMEIWTNQRRVD